MTKHAAARNTVSHATYRDHLVARYLWFLLGVVINSFGIVLITKGALGTSPISSLPYVLSLALPALSFGGWTFVCNLLFIALQVALLRRDFLPAQYLQVVVDVAFSLLIDASDWALAAFDPAALGLAAQAGSVLAGCCVLAFGICVELAPNVLTVPGEGAVRAISSVAMRRVGTVKVAFDTTLVALAAALSLLLLGRIDGLGVGTVVSMLLVGQFVNLFNRVVKPLDRIRALAQG